MKMFKSFSAKWVAAAVIAGFLPIGALATTCVGSAGAVYLLDVDPKNPNNSAGTDPAVGDKGLTVGGAKGDTFLLSAGTSSYCSMTSGGVADSHYPTGQTYNAAGLLDVDSTNGHPAMIHQNIFWKATPDQPGTNYQFCEQDPQSMGTAACTIDGTRWAYKHCCCKVADCSA